MGAWSICRRAARKTFRPGRGAAQRPALLRRPRRRRAGSRAPALFRFSNRGLMDNLNHVKWRTVGCMQSICTNPPSRRLPAGLPSYYPGPEDPHKPSNPAPDPPSTPSKTEDYEANPKNEGAAALVHNLAQAGTTPPTTRPPAPSPQSPAPSSSAPPPATPDFGSHLLANLYLFFSGRLLAELFKEAADTGEAPG